MKPRILVVDDEEKILSILSCVLQDEGYEVTTASSGEEAVARAAEFLPDLTLMDMSMPGIDGITAMVEIRKTLTDVDTIFLTAYGTIKSAVEAIKKGACDFLTKPFDNEELLIVIKRVLEHRRLTLEVETLREQLRERYSFDNIISISSGMRTVFDLMERVCELDATVLIQGESGTGKELVVRAIHQHSPRKNQPLVAVNCGAVPENLIESTFFGHERGAFTDARERKIGKFEQANGGILFLDEIGELSLTAQVKLLRAIETQEIVRVGSNAPIPLNVRIIAATNCNLEEAVSQGLFRGDLFYRLNVFCISIPPLRDRIEDIPGLVDFFLQKYNKKLNLDIENISQTTMNLLQAYDWPGNVRELENALQWAMIVAKRGIIQPQDLPLRIQGYTDVESIDSTSGSLEESVKVISERIEKNLILEVLTANNYNRTETAKALQISRKTLYNKIRYFKLLKS